MPRQSEGMHHYSVRKRVHQRHETFPHPVRWKRAIDHAIYVVGFVGPVMTIPQLMNIWVDKNAAGVSAVSWAAYTVTAFFWMIYGMAHKERPLIVVSMAWIVMDVFVVIGVLVYG